MKETTNRSHFTFPLYGCSIQAYRLWMEHPSSEKVKVKVPSYAPLPPPVNKFEQTPTLPSSQIPIIMPAADEDPSVELLRRTISRDTRAVWARPNRSSDTPFFLSQ